MTPVIDLASGLERTERVSPVAELACTQRLPLWTRIVARLSTNKYENNEPQKPRRLQLTSSFSLRNGRKGVVNYDEEAVIVNESDNTISQPHLKIASWVANSNTTPKYYELLQSGLRTAR